MKTKAKLQQLIHTYTKRRNKYKKSLKNNNKVLRSLNFELQTRQRNEDYFNLITKKVEEFYGEKMPKAENKYKELYCQYCISAGVKSSLVAKYLKYNRPKTIQDKAKKSRDNNKTNTEWQSLNKFMKI